MFTRGDFELDFEFILFNHLRVFSESFAQGVCDYEGMVTMYEQYAMTQLKAEERESLRKYKRVMAILKEYILEYHDKNIQQYEPMSPEHNVASEMRDDDLETFHAIYTNYLLRWLVACTRKTFKGGKTDIYYEKEFFEDLKAEILHSFPHIFDEEIVEEAIAEAE